MKKFGSSKKDNLFLNRKRVVRHTQHTEKFIQELNSPNQNISTPFRTFDEVWVIGKYKGKELKNTPIEYLIWVVNNIKNISSTHKRILENMINKID